MALGSLPGSGNVGYCISTPTYFRIHKLLLNGEDRSQLILEST
jgi:hypothetical protein